MENFSVLIKFILFVMENGSYFSDLSVELLGASVGGFIGTGSALLLYYIQIKDQKRKENLTLFQTQRDILIYFQSLLDMVILAIDETLISMKAFRQELSDDIVNIPLLKIAPVYDFRRIVETIDQEKYFHAYKALVKDEILLKIFSNIDFLYATMLDLEKMYNREKDFDYEKKKEISKLSGELLQKMSLTIRNYQQTVGREDEKCKIINQYVLVYYKILEENPTGLLNIRNFFLKPLLEKIVSIKEFEEITIITSKASELNKLITPVLYSNQRLLQNIDGYISTLSTVNEKIKERKVPLSTFLSQNLSN